MKPLSRIIADNETWLVRRIVSLAKTYGYTKYTSTLEEAWRLSIQGLSQSLMLGIESFEGPADFGPDDKFVDDPLTNFGVIEAKRHRERGTTLTMFLGLMKYYKQAYVDLLALQSLAESEREPYRLVLERCFDRIEIAFLHEWMDIEQTPLMEVLQSTTREMTNEKNVYLTVFESLSDAVIMLDEQDFIIHMNHQAASLANPSHVPGAPYHRMHQAEAETKPDLQSSWPAKRSSKQPLAEVFPWLESPLAAGRSGPEGIEPSNLAVTLQGARRCFEINCSMMLDVSEKFLAHIVTLRDITERRRQEEMLSKRALEIERLRQWESLGMLASGIAHDFNNLLAAIDGRCRMIRKRVPAEDEIMRSSVRYILEAVDKGVELTKTMRACSGREVGWAAHQDLSALVRLWAEDLTEPIPSHVHVSIHADTPLPGVPLHRGHIYVVLSNLLANALEALVDNKPGTIVIKTGITSREPQPGFQSIFFRETSALQFVYVEVEDNGAGIDESILPKILDPFFSTKFIGRGLGLAAVRGVVAGHRGALNIRTVLGQGTAIQVLFPIETPGDA